MDYFKQKLKAGEIGSSAMPHKVNPIDFENAEGNLWHRQCNTRTPCGQAACIAVAATSPTAPVLRNVVCLWRIAYCLYQYSKGLNKLILNESAINSDLEDNWAVVAEAIQTILRREGFKTLRSPERFNPDQCSNHQNVYTFIHWRAFRNWIHKGGA